MDSFYCRALETARRAKNASQAQAIMLREFLTRAGFDFVSPLRPVAVSLAFPQPQLPNRVHVLDATGGVVKAVDDARAGFVLKPEMNVTVSSMNIEVCKKGFFFFARRESFDFLQREILDM